MKYVVEKLSGAKLDAAVAVVLGKRYALSRTLADNPGPYQCRLIETGELFEPSTNWTHGGPIIDTYGIAISGRKSIADPLGFSDWVAHINGICLYGKDDVDACGCTALIAAMRAFVAFKLGAEVDL